MQTMDIGSASDCLTEVVEQVLANKHPVRIDRRGEPLAAVVPIADFELINRLESGTPAERETQHRKSQTLFEETERLARLGHWEWDEIADRCTYCSEELARLHGITAAEYLERATSIDADLNWVHPDDRAAVLAEISETKRRGRGYDIEYRLLQPDGGWIEVREVSQVILDDAGSVVRSFGFVQDLTERKKSEAALGQTQALLKKAMQTARMGFWVWDDTNNECLHCSEELARLFGQSVEAYLATRGKGANIAASIHPDDRAHYLAGVDAATKAGGRYQVSFREKVADGTYRDFVEVGEPLDADQGQPRRSIGIVQDVSEFKRIEAALRRAHDELEQRVADRTAELREKSAQLQSIMDHSPAMIFLKDAAGRYVVVNREFERLFGITNDAIRGELPKEVLPAGLAKSSRAQELEVQRSGQPSTKEETFEIDGGERTYLTTKFPVLAGADQLIGTVATDITDRKRAEQGIRTRDAWLRSILDNSPIEIVLKNVEGRIMAISRNVGKVLGCSEAELIGGTTRDFLAPDIAEVYMAADRRVVETGEALQQEVREDVDGKVRYSLNQKFPMQDEQGAIQGICSLTTDITERKAAEERLRQTQKMEAVGQLTGGVAHDFNNLLAVIMGNIDLLRERLGQECGELGTILRAAERGAELTQRLLAFSRQQPLRPQAVDLGTLVSGMSDLLRRTLGETIEIETITGPDLWAASADPGQVENALLNLALNARDAMPGGKLTIECANAQLDDAYLADNPEAPPGDYAVLSISDEGSGMTAEVRSHAFEPFFTTKEVGQGSGLGLSMVYGFAKQSGGHVSLDSEEGRGTTVTLYLPRAKEAARRADAKYAAEAPRGAGERILVIEDDPDVRALTVRLLEGLGYRTIDVAEAAAADETLANGPPVDLVLSDVVLPGGTSGPAFAEQARATYPDLKIIFMSGYPTEAAKRNGFINTDSVLLNKPFQRRRLAMALRDAFD